MSFEKIRIEESTSSLSQVSYSDYDFDRMDLEFRSSREEIAVDEMDSNFYCEIRFESDQEFIKDCSNEKYFALQ